MADLVKIDARSTPQTLGKSPESPATRFILTQVNHDK
jgi:hypothetical protein